MVIKLGWLGLTIYDLRFIISKQSNFGAQHLKKNLTLHTVIRCRLTNHSLRKSFHISHPLGEVSSSHLISTLQRYKRMKKRIFQVWISPPWGPLVMVEAHLEVELGKSIHPQLIHQRKWPRRNEIRHAEKGYSESLI